MTNHCDLLPDGATDRPARRWRDRVSPRVTMIAVAAPVVLLICAFGPTVWNPHKQTDISRQSRQIAQVFAEQTLRSFHSVDLVLSEVAARIAADDYSIGAGPRPGCGGNYNQRQVRFFRALMSGRMGSMCDTPLDDEQQKLATMARESTNKLLIAITTFWSFRNWR